MPDTCTGLGFRFEGRRIPAVPGQSLAAALAAAGELVLGTGKDGSPRGAFCGMGVCHDCLVVVDGRAGQRACMTAARDGAEVSRQPLRPDLADPALRPLATLGVAGPERACDLLVVGAGPAGLAAAVAARDAGADVVLVDERPSPGGQYYKQPATGDAATRADGQARRGAALVARARALGVEIRSGVAVWGAERRHDGALAVSALEDGAGLTLVPRALVVATGAYERAPLFPGWTLPGVMTSGALQTLLRADGTVPRGRILVAGNGPLNIQVAVEALRRGAQVVGVVEAAPEPGPGSAAGLDLLRADTRLAAAGVAALARLRMAGVPVHWGRRVVAVLGDGRARSARVAPVDGAGAAYEVAAEIVALGEGFGPRRAPPPATSRPCARRRTCGRRSRPRRRCGPTTRGSRWPTRRATAQRPGSPPPRAAAAQRAAATAVRCRGAGPAGAARRPGAEAAGPHRQAGQGGGWPRPGEPTALRHPLPPPAR